jgi:uncharacterized protein (TIGR02246 family)
MMPVRQSWRHGPRHHVQPSPRRVNPDPDREAPRRPPATSPNNQPRRKSINTGSTNPSTGHDAAARALYRTLIECWNGCDAAGFAACSADDGTVVGFDRTTVAGHHAIAAHLSEVFTDMGRPRTRDVRQLLRLDSAVCHLPIEVGKVVLLYRRPDVNDVASMAAVRQAESIARTNVSLAASLVACVNLRYGLRELVAQQVGYARLTSRAADPNSAVSARMKECAHPVNELANHLSTQAAGRPSRCAAGFAKSMAGSGGGSPRRRRQHLTSRQRPRPRSTTRRWSARG